MTTLIAVYNSSGCVGRCDARCYEAQEPQCDCICHGRNHGAGIQKATDNTRELAESWMQEYNQAHNLTGATWEVPANNPIQLNLF
jgi:hypothetical protein